MAAVDPGSLKGLDHPVLIINRGEPATLPEALDAPALAATLPGATFLSVPGAAHFRFLAECSRLSVIVIALAGEDNICSDRGLRDRGQVHDALRHAIASFLKGSLAL